MPQRGIDAKLFYHENDRRLIIQAQLQLTVRTQIAASQLYSDSKELGCTRRLPHVILVLPEFAWLGEKTTGLARASCFTKEHIRAIDGSVPVEKASNLHATPCRAEMAEIEVAQNALCSAAPPGLAKSRQRIDGHRRSFAQIPEGPVILSPSMDSG